MNKNQLLALAAFITSLANGDGESVQQPTPDPDVPATSKKRGRPPITATPPPPAEPATITEGVEGKGKTFIAEKTKEVLEQPAPAGGKTIDDMRALIEPLIKGSWNGKPQAEWQPRGGEVKPIIAKYAPTLIQMEAKDYAAFEKDIEALLY